MSFIQGAHPATLDTPGARAFSCGHFWTFTSTTARKRWEHSRECPTCWVAHPTVSLKVVRCERRHGFCGEFFPGVVLNVEPSAAQGYVTPEATVKVAKVKAREILAALELTDQAPGVDLADPSMAVRFEAAIDLLLAAGVRLWVGGTYARKLVPEHRQGWLEG